MKAEQKYRSWTPVRMANENQPNTPWWVKPGQQLRQPDFVRRQQEEILEPGEQQEHPLPPPVPEAATKESSPIGPVPPDQPELIAEKAAPLVLESAAEVQEKIMKLGALLDQITRESAGVMAECVTAVTGKLLRKKVQIDRSWLLGNLQRALGRIPPNGRIVVRLNPTDLEALKKMPQPPAWLAQSAGGLELTADAELEPGDCVVESSRARVDTRLQSQLESVRPLVEEIIALALSEGGGNER